MIVDCIYDGTVFEMQTPTATAPSTNINTQTEIVNAAQDDEFLVYNQVA
jgi:hypothetical protein